MTLTQEAKKSKNWQLLNHTADLRIEVRGESPADLFVNAANALSSLLIGDAEITPNESRDLVLEAPTMDDLLVDWLRELLFEHQVHGKIPVHAEIIIVTETFLKAQVRFGFVPEGSPQQIEIKGVTYHGLKVVHRGNKYAVRIIFDI